jgi:hypothetical protein
MTCADIGLSAWSLGLQKRFATIGDLRKMHTPTAKQNLVTRASALDATLPANLRRPHFRRYQAVIEARMTEWGQSRIFAIQRVNR